MLSSRLVSSVMAPLAVVLGLALLHACQDTPKPTEPAADAVVLRKTLTVKGGGTGSGVVTSSPAGINCIVTEGVAATTGCVAKFNQDVVVTLTPVPKSGHSFKAWSIACTGSGTCQVAMTVNRTVSAHFLKGPFKIQITAAGTGNGTVKSQAGLTPVINCTITNGVAATTGCSARYPAYTALTLTATPKPGFAFSGWGGPCSGTGSCTYTVIQARSIAAAFGSVGPDGPAAKGKWGPVFSTPVIAVHAHLLTTGKVLFWGGRGETQTWDPENPDAGFTTIPKTHTIFCSGHTFLADGRLLITGGTLSGTTGHAKAVLMNASGDGWALTASMAQGRYYPTLTTLPNGDVLAVSGSDENDAVVTIPEVWDGTNWRRLTNASLSIPTPYYPSMFVAPNGKVFLAGFQQTSRYLDISGTGMWTTVGNRNTADGRLGTAVMYAPGKVLYAGGGDPPTNAAEVIDLNQSSPAWRRVARMAFARRQLNATILADGQVLVTHGTSGAGFNNVANAVRMAELWNPVTESWTSLADESKPRAYHSTALLLPDGRVLSSGSGEGGGVPYAESEFSAQVFSPPYLFEADGSQAPRPSIASAPSKISYGQSFTVGTPDAVPGTRGTLIRLSSVTHAFNQSQLIYPLTFSVTGSSTLSAVGPANANLAPPGPYMLFLLNGKGVPSMAKMVSVGP